MALVVRGLVLLRENRLAVDGGHAEECTQPHPENRTRPPEYSAVAAPAMLPVPTCAAIAVVSAWNGLMPSLPAFSPLSENGRTDASSLRRTYAPE